jgi:hypothetical protein
VSHGSISAAFSRCGQSAVSPRTMTHAGVGAVVGDQRVEPVAAAAFAARAGNDPTYSAP